MPRSFIRLFAAPSSRRLAFALASAVLLFPNPAEAEGLSKVAPLRPGSLTVTAVSRGLSITAQTPPIFHARLVCPEGYRVTKLGGKSYPPTRRIVEEDVPAGQVPPESAPDFHTACKGGHGAVEASMGFAATCKQVKVTYFVPSLPFVPSYQGQFGLRCENVPMVGVPNPKRALRLYWSGQRQDNFTAATEAGYAAAGSAGYDYPRIEGQLYSKPAENLVPMKLYWSAERKDNMSVVTPEDEAAAKTAGYQFARIQGYLYPADTHPVPKGTLPLELYWNAQRGDHISVAHPETKKAVGAYQRVRLQGYILKVPRPEELDANGRFK